jgi:hypothetical protein
MRSAFRIVFMGTPDFAVPSLQTLLAGPHRVIAVVCQPDRQRGRGKIVHPPPVKVLADSAWHPGAAAGIDPQRTFLPADARAGSGSAWSLPTAKSCPKRCCGCLHWAQSMSMARCCPNTGEQPPFSGRWSTARPKPVSPSCRWMREWIPVIFSSPHRRPSVPAGNGGRTL